MSDIENIPFFIIVKNKYSDDDKFGSSDFVRGYQMFSIMKQTHKNTHLVTSYSDAVSIIKKYKGKTQIPVIIMRKPISYNNNLIKEFRKKNIL